MSLPSTEALSTGYFFRACTAALTKKDMKPSLVPCSLVKASWNFLRRSITGAMFTSLNVVRMALVDCDCSRRSATRARRRLMGTRCSGRPLRSSLAAGADTWGSALVGTPVGMTAAVDCTPPLTAARASPLVTRPSLPEPATLAADRLFSASSLAAAGAATAPLLPPVAAAAAGGASRGAGGGGGGGGGGGAGPPPPPPRGGFWGGGEGTRLLPRTPLIPHPPFPLKKK